jgi:hypothetical protein
MNMRRFTSCSGITLLLVVFAARLATAQDVDPPARAARLSDAEGAVTLQPAGLEEWTPAPLNRPLGSGDRLWTDQGARAELDLGDAWVRLDSNTGFGFLALDDSTTQMQLTAGSLIVQVRDVQPGEVFEVDTPNLAVSLQQPGEYRIDVSAAGDATSVSVADGAAQALDGAGELVAIGPQQSVAFSGGGAPSYSAGALPAEDDFGAWSDTRDEELEPATSTSAQYVATDTPGSADLDANGTWQQLPDYGYVWTPTLVVAGWAPYRFGRWLWVSPWGWTWVDDAPWGYAPFHYGRWISCHNTWCWVPGPRQLRAQFVPAQVAWGSGAAAVSWFPLAPRELYTPAVPVSVGYLRRVNLANTAGVAVSALTVREEKSASPPRSLNAATGLTSVAPAVFISAQRVNGHLVRISPSAWLASAPPILPTRASLLGAAEGKVRGRAPAPPRAVLARHPPPLAPLPFERLLGALEANGGRLPAPGTLARLQSAMPVTAVRVLSPPANARAISAPLGIAARERLLEQTRLEPAPAPIQASSVAASAPPAPVLARANAFVPPDLSEDSPPQGAAALPAHRTPQPRQAPSGTYAPHEPARLPAAPHSTASSRPALPPPDETAAPALEAQPARGASEPAPAGAAPPVIGSTVRTVPPNAHSPPVPPHERAHEPRGTAPHADRESRERVLR